jgi:hypothetical protein
VFHARVVTEIDEQADLKACGAQVVHELRTMLIGQSADRLEFDEYLAKTDQVRPIDLPTTKYAELMEKRKPAVLLLPCIPCIPWFLSAAYFRGCG